MKIDRRVEIFIPEDECCLCICFQRTRWHIRLKTLLKKSPTRMLGMAGSYLSPPPEGSTDDRKGISGVEDDGVICSQSIIHVSVKCEEFGFAHILSLGLEI